MSGSRRSTSGELPGEERRVRETNARFYAALNALDIQEMTDLWLCTPDAVCVHPGRAAIRGYARVLESWQQIFSHTQSLTVSVSEVSVVIDGDAAWIICLETISLVSADGLALVAAAQATNIYHRDPAGQWRMAVHHASPTPLPPQEEWPDVIN